MAFSPGPLVSKWLRHAWGGSWSSGTGNTTDFLPCWGWGGQWDDVKHSRRPGFLALQLAAEHPGEVPGLWRHCPDRFGEKMKELSLPGPSLGFSLVHLAGSLVSLLTTHSLTSFFTHPTSSHLHSSSYPFIHPSIHLPIFLSIVCPSTQPTLHPSIHPSIHPLTMHSSTPRTPTAYHLICTNTRSIHGPY